jgi:DNA-3-methyladenine glycosylase I
MAVHGEKNRRRWGTSKAMLRCAWTGEDPRMIAYHDQEWGVPVHDDRVHFEFMTLEAAQAGLSWRVVLHKRENYRRLFHGFDPTLVATMGEADVERLVLDAGIIRNRAKIKAAISNASRFLEVQKEFGSFDAYLWSFVDGRPIVNRFETLEELPATTPESDAFAKDLKARGFKFMGATVCYAHMQAVGLVNDHLIGCPRWSAVQEQGPTL